MSALAGNLPGFEEALRALFALDSAQFALQISGWPDDVRKYLTKRANEIMSFDREAEPIRSHS
jgi:hypothetical protein